MPATLPSRALLSLPLLLISVVFARSNLANWSNHEDLVSLPRWPGDHTGTPGRRRFRAGEEEILMMLGEAEILYDFPRGHVRDLVRVAPQLRWVQASMTGAGEVAQKAGLQDTNVTVTTASGVYSVKVGRGKVVDEKALIQRSHALVDLDQRPPRLRYPPLDHSLHHRPRQPPG